MNTIRKQKKPRDFAIFIIQRQGIRLSPNGPFYYSGWMSDCIGKKVWVANDLLIKKAIRVFDAGTDEVLGIARIYKPSPLKRSSKKIFIFKSIKKSPPKKKELTVWICGCTTIQELLNEPFDLESNCDDSKARCLRICKQCREDDSEDCKKEPIEVKLTISAKVVG